MIVLNELSNEAMEKARAMLTLVAPETAGPAGRERLNLGAYLEHYRIPYHEKHDGTSVYHVLENGCLFDPNHGRNEASIIQRKEGPILYHCYHASCRHTWREARAVISGDDPLSRFIEGKKGNGTDGSPDNLLAILEHCTMGIEQFLGTDFPKPEMILKPWLRTGTLGMIYAWRARGKTWLGLAIALSITRNVPLGPWTVEKPVGCLLVDGEMFAADTQERFNRLKAPLPPPEKHLFILSSDVVLRSGMPTPNLADPAWREAMYRFVVKYRSAIDVVILDNISSLAQGIDENTKSEWDGINTFLRSFRALGVAVILIHHAGKSGAQRGTSGREDNLDVVIRLDLPKGYRATDGARLVIGFEKRRGFFGNDAAPFQMDLTSAPGGGLVWVIAKADADGSGTPTAKQQSKKAVIVSLLGHGMEQGKVPALCDVTKGYVSQVKAQAIKAGELTSDGRAFTERGKEAYAEVDISEFMS